MSRDAADILAHDRVLPIKWLLFGSYIKCVQKKAQIKKCAAPPPPLVKFCLFPPLTNTKTIYCVRVTFYLPKKGSTYPLYPDVYKYWHTYR